MALDRDTTITWHGHACVEVTTPGGRTILFDPWFGNPKSTKSADAVDRCDLLLVTHGHADHLGDAVALASRLRPAWPCIHEMSLWLARRLPGGSDQVTGMNKGGTVEAAGLRVTMTGAAHSAGDWNAEAGTTLYLGEPAGFVVELENGFRIYQDCNGTVTQLLDVGTNETSYGPLQVCRPGRVGVAAYNGYGESMVLWSPQP